MTNYDLNCLVWPAMRYALARHTSVVDTVCRSIIRNAKNIRSDIGDQMMEEIVNEINRQNTETNMDIKQWEQVCLALSENKKLMMDNAMQLLTR